MEFNSFFQILFAKIPYKLNRIRRQKRSTSMDNLLYSYQKLRTAHFWRIQNEGEGWNRTELPIQILRKVAETLVKSRIIYRNASEFFTTRHYLY
jgi:hypothetical protein